MLNYVYDIDAHVDCIELLKRLISRQAINVSVTFLVKKIKSGLTHDFQDAWD